MDITYQEAAYQVTQPEFLSLEKYDDLNNIKEKFKPLRNINSSDDSFIKNWQNNRYFVIRTQGEDNVHRAMKYGIWTSSSRKNERLQQAYEESKKQDGSVYLFYTEINSQCFSGVAKLVSDFNKKGHFKYWLYENKWFGSFNIEWVFVKDVPFNKFEGLVQSQKLEGSEETIKQVFELIDCTELNQENGKKMLEAFHSHETKDSLFHDFNELDKRENQCRESRKNNPYIEKKFKELTKVFETIPFKFSVSSYERKQLQKQTYYQNQQWGGYNPYTNQYFPYNYYQPYWEQNNGFYSQKQQQEHKESYEEQVNEPLNDRFQVKHKKLKKQQKANQQTEYVPKQQ